MSINPLRGKSQAAMITAQAMVAHDANTRIGVASESVYKRLIEIGIPEANLVKMWEKQEDKPMEIWYDEIKEFCKQYKINTFVGERND